MQESALGSVFIFQKRGIGLDNYKSKESLSRVVHLLDFIRMQMADGIDQMVTLHQMQKLE